MNAIYCIDRLTWRGIGITVEYCPRWLGASAGIQTAHLQVRSDNETPLPITETGYRSHFFGPVDPELSLTEVEQMFREWLEAEAAKPAWQEHCRQSAQLNLF